MDNRAIPDVSELLDAFSKLSISNDPCANSQSEPSVSLLSPYHSMWIPTKSVPLPTAVSSLTQSHKQSRTLKKELSARSSLREIGVIRLSPPQTVSSRMIPYHHSKPQPSLPRRIPQSQPQLISYRRYPSRSRTSRSPSASSLASDDSYASSSDSELGTPPPITTNLPIYSSEKESPSSYLSPISLPELSKALSQPPIAPRTYTFRTTIAPS